MVEILFPDVTNNEVRRINRYGKVIRIRLLYEGTHAASKYWNFEIVGVNGEIKFKSLQTDWEGAAQTSFRSESCRSWDVNIDLDKDDYITVLTDASNGKISSWLDIIQPKSSKDRQFHDQLMGIHTGTT